MYRITGMDEYTTKSTLLNKTATASAQYGNLFPLRAAIQAIPIIGGSLDTMISGPGQNWQQKRMLAFVDDLQKRISRLELNSEILLDETEELADLFIGVLERVRKTRSAEKIHYFGSIVINQIRDQESWETSEWAVRLVDELTDLHITVLAAIAISPKNSNNPLAGIRAVRIWTKKEDEESNVIKMDDLIPNHLAVIPFSIYSELVSKGLLIDEGIGRLGVSGMQILAPTKEADRFLAWLKEPT
jgi:hypothetical protein